MQTIDRTAPIMVTGGTGFIAGRVIKYLLEDGLTVHATVRDPGREDKVGHLAALADNSPGTIKLFKADLLNESDFDEPMQDCQLVMHTASPFIISGFKDARTELIEPALAGTENVLNAANRTDTVKRVVLTSSVAAMYGDNADFADIENGTLTEKDWNTTSSESHQPYCYSKTLAEKRAIEINTAQDRWDMVTINPSTVYGPSLTKATASGSVGVMIQFGDGTAKFGVPNLELGVVDVRDVARAHILAGFTPEASDRHIVCAGVVSLFETGQILRKHFGDKYPFPKMVSPKFVVWLIAPLFGTTRKYISKNVGYPAKYDNSYSIKDLGIEYRPMEATIIEHFQQLIDDGLVKRR